jgi:hypothetical protein
MNQRQALEMAQKVMQSWQGQAPFGFNEAFQAVNQALEQSEPVQDPQAFLHWYDNAHWGNEDFKEGCHRSWNAAIKYATSPAAQPAAWVDLTDEDIEESFEYALAKYVEEVDPDFHSVSSQVDYVFARAIGAKLREKNGGA